MKNDSRIFKAIGLMSGTSMDGVDAALVETDGVDIIKPLFYCSSEYDPSFKIELRNAEKIVSKAKKDITAKETILKSTNYHAEAVSKLIKSSGLSANEIDVIGYHGQSLYHNPQEKITIQMGDAKLLNEITNITVVNDFRSRDIENGGQGAPLAPLYHQALARKNNLFPAAFVNCGGITNISLIYDSTENGVIGYDLGPGNVLIDRYIRLKTRNAEFMDKNGQYGLKGTINEQIFNELINSFSHYLNKPFPKSLDPSNFDLPQDIFNLNINDACATLEKFTAYCVISSVSKEHFPLNWILAGGGWNNPVILSYFKEYLLNRNPKAKIISPQDIGSNQTYIEAEIFAFLAVRTLQNLPITLPKITGVSHPCRGGKIYTGLDTLPV